MIRFCWMLNGFVLADCGPGTQKLHCENILTEKWMENNSSSYFVALSLCAPHTFHLISGIFMAKVINNVFYRVDSSSFRCHYRNKFTTLCEAARLRGTFYIKTVISLFSLPLLVAFDTHILQWLDGSVEKWIEKRTFFLGNNIFPPLLWQKRWKCDVSIWLSLSFGICFPSYGIVRLPVHTSHSHSHIHTSDKNSWRPAAWGVEYQSMWARTCRAHKWLNLIYLKMLAAPSSVLRVPNFPP